MEARAKTREARRKRGRGPGGKALSSERYRDREKRGWKGKRVAVTGQLPLSVEVTGICSTCVYRVSVRVFVTSDRRTQIWDGWTAAWVPGHNGLLSPRLDPQNSENNITGEAKSKSHCQLSLWTLGVLFPASEQWGKQGSLWFFGGRQHFLN